MRMWMVNPEVLCRRHLLGEHSEIHKHRHVFEKRISIKNRILKGQIEPLSMKERHDELVSEMLKRSYKHNSEYIQPDISYLSPDERNFRVNREGALSDLLERCEECRRRYNELKRDEDINNGSQ